MLDGVYVPSLNNPTKRAVVVPTLLIPTSYLSLKHNKNLSSHGLSILGRLYSPPTYLAGFCTCNKISFSLSHIYSIETKRDAKDFDLIGFSVQFELQFTNIVYMLDLMGIPYYASQRGEEFPPIVAGGPCVVNPMPFAPFFDAVLIGEGITAATLLFAKSFKIYYRIILIRQSSLSQRAVAMSLHYKSRRAHISRVVSQACADNVDVRIKAVVVNVFVEHSFGTYGHTGRG